MKYLIGLLAAGTLASACGTDDLLGNEGFEINCDGVPCDWILVEGQAEFSSSWHTGDAGADLSGDGRVVIEQRSAPFSLPSRELVLSAALARRDGALLRFELEWFVAGSGAGPTYWDRQPVSIDNRILVVGPSGVFSFEELVSSPSLEASGLIMRLVKEGRGTAIIDEVFLGEMQVAQ